jgi:ASC-1-like (ASCH) protein
MERKHIQSIWMDHIISGKKTWEGRCNFGTWKYVEVGDRIVLTDALREQTVEIEDIKYFGDFGEAWFILGDSLIPSEVCDIVMKSQADNIYRKYYTDHFIRENGVIAFKLKLI